MSVWKFWSSFFKSSRSQGRGALVASAEAKPPYRRFLLLAGRRLRLRAERSEAIFILRLVCQKKSGKIDGWPLWRKENTHFIHLRRLPAFFFDTGSANENMLRCAQRGGASAVRLSKKETRIGEISLVATSDRRARRLRQAFEKA